MVPEYFIGLMSGTSLDGIDGVIADLSSPTPRVITKAFLAFDQTIKQDLLTLHKPSHNELHLAHTMANQLADLYNQIVTKLLEQAQLHSTQISAIGCHGQTVRHNPESAYTIQLGNAAKLAELSNITVVNDFRSRDIAAGGQGAPLVPAFHDCILRHPTIHRVIVNIGGISNLTNLVPNQVTSGFDCGPGNLLMDSWCQEYQNLPYDRDGQWARTGKVLPVLLQSMLQQDFFSLPPPKSTGRDLFNIFWLKRHLSGSEQAQDVQATLATLTATSITQSITQHCAGAEEIYLCGGGAQNKYLTELLRTLLPQSCRLATTNELSVDADYLEALAFAWLAQQTLKKKAANLPTVTGARHPCILGAVYFS